MSDIQAKLAEMKARCEKATAGPWKVSVLCDDAVYPVTPEDSPPVCIMGRAHKWRGARELIAHARTDLPMCIAMLEVAVKRLEKIASVTPDDHLGAQEALRAIESLLEGGGK